MANPCPSVVALDSALKNSIPFLKGNFKDAKGPSMRTQIMTGSGRHATGLALDIFLFAMPWYKDKAIDHVNEQKLGENLVKTFIDLKNSMQWTEMIYMNRIFIAPDRYVAWTKDNAHYTHIHIDWMTNSYKGSGKPMDVIVDNSPQGKITDFASQLSAKLDQINAQWESKSLSNVDIKSIYPIYALDANPVGIWEIRVDKWFWIYTLTPNGKVTWIDPYSKISGTGSWTKVGNDIIYKWDKSTSIETWKLPIIQSKLTGNLVMHGKKYTVNSTKTG
jgi:hypothetical protein